MKISFSEKDFNGHDIYKIERDDIGQIDFFKTLKALAERDDIDLIKIKQEYLEDSPFDGLFLILYIRLSFSINSNICFVPITFDTNPDYNPLKQIIFLGITSKNLLTENTYLNCVPTDLSNISRIKLKTIIDSLPILISNIEDSHDLANLWGPYRLNYAISILEGNKDYLMWYNDFPKLRNRSEAWMLISQSYLNGKISIDELKKAKWNESLKLITNKIYRILLIDDEVDNGWDFTIDKLLKNIFKSQYQLVIIKDLENKRDEYIEQLNCHNFDLVICDLRLTKNDKSKGSYDDVDALDNLLSTKIIKYIKKQYANIPIILFTASNKTWTSEYVKNEGVDYVWIKEDPGRGVNDNYSIQSAIDLKLNTIKAINKKEEISFVWDFLGKINLKLKNKTYISNLKKFDTDIVLRLCKIKVFGEIIYGLLSENKNKFISESFLKDYSKVDIALLFCFGCFNQIQSIRFKNKINDGKLLMSDNTELIYYNVDKNSVIIYHEILINYFKEGKHNKLKELKPIEHHNPSDHMYLRIIYCAEQTKYSKICSKDELKQLNNKRNYLDIIHGVGQNNNPQITLEDIKLAIRLIDSMILF